MAQRPAFDLTLYLVAGSDAVGGRPLDAVVEAAVRGGVTMVQLREKTMPDGEVIDLVRRLKSMLAPYGVPLIVNDRVEVARAADADGVHLGVEDVAAAHAREVLGPGRIVGVSAGTDAEAALVDPAQADYAGVGSVYPTSTKPDAGPAIGLDGLVALRRKIPLPVVAIGGITTQKAAEVMATGVDGIAVVSAICGAPDPEAVARDLRRAIAAGRAAASG
jgi:thiamine-phosphate pyrophosphorylase